MEITELVTYIKAFGGMATTDEIIHAYEVTHKVWIQSEQKAIIKNSLLSNPDIVFLNEDGFWELKNTPTEPIDIISSYDFGGEIDDYYRRHQTNPLPENEIKSIEKKLSQLYSVLPTNKSKEYYGFRLFLGSTYVCSYWCKKEYIHLVIHYKEIKKSLSLPSSLSQRTFFDTKSVERKNEYVLTQDEAWFILQEIANQLRD